MSPSVALQIMYLFSKAAKKKNNVNLESKGTHTGRMERGISDCYIVEELWLCRFSVTTPSMENNKGRTAH